MTALRAALALLPVCSLAACLSLGGGPPPQGDPGTKGFPAGPEVVANVYLPADRSGTPPKGYGLYTMVLTRTANRQVVRVLTDLFASTSNARDAALARETLNLIQVPVKSAAEADRVLKSARSQPDMAAAALMQRHYDFDQAARLMASVCRPDRGEAVMKVCGSTMPDGPLLVTGLRPLDEGSAVQRLLVVNLSATPPEAVREVMSAYQEQITSKAPLERARLDTLRLQALDHILAAARVLPLIRKAYAEAP
jgi:hypothetical protein